jgi:glutamate synthase (NADPH/NADH) small chain
VVDRRLDLLRDEGIELVPNAHVGESPSAEELLGSFDAVLLAVGALQGRELPVPGRDLDGIHLAMDYLTQQNRRVASESVDSEIEITARGKRVVILGGGDTSADCLGNAHREGAASVQVLTHGPKPPQTAHALAWPDWPFILRTHPAHEEGGERRWAVRIEGFTGEHKRVEQMHAIEVQRLPDGTTQPLPGTEHVVEADLVLLAIGFSGPVRDRLHEDLGLEYDRQGAIRSDEQFRTCVSNVYVAGDAKRGASLIVWAIQEGRQAAQEIDGALSVTADASEMRARAS